MNISIATIGNEVVKGRTLDTNFTEISKFFTEAGENVIYHVSCRDIQSEIDTALTFLMKNSDVIITTGGLGPTMDDITINSIAKSLKVNLSYNQEYFKKLEASYKKRGLEFTEERKKMSLLPIGSETITNNVGSAPGMFLRFNEKIIISLPGVPAEMRSMLPIIGEKLNLGEKHYISREYRIIGIMESSLAPVAKEISRKLKNDIYIKSHPVSFENNLPILILEVYGYGPDETELKARVDKTVQELAKLVKTIFKKDILNSGEL